MFSHPAAIDLVRQQLFGGPRNQEGCVPDNVWQYENEVDQFLIATNKKQLLLINLVIYDLGKIQKD